MGNGSSKEGLVRLSVSTWSKNACHRIPSSPKNRLASLLCHTLSVAGSDLWEVWEAKQWISEHIAGTLNNYIPCSYRSEKHILITLQSRRPISQNKFGRKLLYGSYRSLLPEEKPRGGKKCVMNYYLLTKAVLRDETDTHLLFLLYTHCLSRPLSTWV